MSPALSRRARNSETRKRMTRIESGSISTMHLCIHRLPPLRIHYHARTHTRARAHKHARYPEYHTRHLQVLKDTY